MNIADKVKNAESVAGNVVSEEHVDLPEEVTINLPEQDARPLTFSHE